MRFKVGDKVTIRKPTEDELVNWNNRWVSEMDNYVGRQMEIEHVVGGDIRLIGVTWDFPAETKASAVRDVICTADGEVVL